MSQLVQPRQFTILGDYYKISIYSQVAPCVISIAGRLRSPEGEFNNFDHRVDVIATGAQTVFRRASGAWWIMSLVASVVSGTVNPGDVLVKVELTQGVSPGNVPHQVLLFGSPDSFMPLTMGSPGEFSADGRRSRLRVLTIADPDPGVTDVSWTVPDGLLWEPISINMSVMTEAAIGAARVYEDFISGAGVIWQYNEPISMGPGETRIIIASQGQGLYTAVGTIVELLGLPTITLTPGQMVEAGTFGNAGTTTLGQLSLTVRETILGS